MGRHGVPLGQRRVTARQGQLLNEVAALIDASRMAAGGMRTRLRQVAAFRQRCLYQPVSVRRVFLGNSVVGCIGRNELGQVGRKEQCCLGVEFIGPRHSPNDLVKPRFLQLRTSVRSSFEARAVRDDVERVRPRRQIEPPACRHETKKVGHGRPGAF